MCYYIHGATRHKWYVNMAIMTVGRLVVFFVPTILPSGAAGPHRQQKTAARLHIHSQRRVCCYNRGYSCWRCCILSITCTRHRLLQNVETFLTLFRLVTRLFKQRWRNFICRHRHCHCSGWWFWYSNCRKNTTIVRQRILSAKAAVGAYPVVVWICYCCWWCCCCSFMVFPIVPALNALCYMESSYTGSCLFPSSSQ